MALRQTYTKSVTLNAAGAGSVSFTMRGDVLVQHTRVVVKTAAGGAPVLQSTAMVDTNGDDFEGSYSGNNDASDTTHLLTSGEILTCTWTGGDANAVATCVLRGVQFKAGDGIKAISNALQ